MPNALTQQELIVVEELIDIFDRIDVPTPFNFVKHSFKKWIELATVKE